MLPQRPYPRALDIGSGLGSLTRKLAPFTGQICGTDISAVAIEKARKLSAALPNVTYSQEDMLEGPQWGNLKKRIFTYAKVGGRPPFPSFELLVREIGGYQLLRCNLLVAAHNSVLDTTRSLPVARYQVGDPGIHPRHVSAPDLVLLTGNLGCLHAYFLHSCRWEEGWVGFGNRIHRADFRSLVTIGPPLRLQSKETKAREGPKRVVLRYEFRFWQEERLVYFGDQSAIFVKGRAFEGD